MGKERLMQWKRNAKILENLAKLDKSAYNNKNNRISKEATDPVHFDLDKRRESNLWQK